MKFPLALLTAAFLMGGCAHRDPFVVADCDIKTVVIDATGLAFTRDCGSMQFLNRPVPPGAQVYRMHKGGYNGHFFTSSGLHLTPRYATSPLEGPSAPRDDVQSYIAQ
jgi:hypothetical protein